MLIGWQVGRNKEECDTALCVTMNTSSVNKNVEDQNYFKQLLHINVIMKENDSSPVIQK